MGDNFLKSLMNWLNGNDQGVSNSPEPDNFVMRSSANKPSYDGFDSWAGNKDRFNAQRYGLKDKTPKMNGFAQLGAGADIAQSLANMFLGFGANSNMEKTMARSDNHFNMEWNEQARINNQNREDTYIGRIGDNADGKYQSLEDWKATPNRMTEYV